jgi:hypothetical protein
MRQLIGKAAAVGFLALIALWIIGLVREASVPYPQPAGWNVARGITLQEVQADSNNGFDRQVISNNLKQLGLALTPLPMVLDQPDLEKLQVFEKTAQLAVGSDTFDDDEAAIHSALAAHHAVAFNERRGGLEPARRLLLDISVPTDEFDALVAKLQQIGQLQSISVQKRDRTSEFRRLHAQRLSLKQYLASVLKLRGGKQGSIEDELKLEQKIQDIEKELRTLSVQMGDFLGKESYYHVSLTLTEFLPGSRFDRTYAVPQRVAHAFVWAIGWWTALVLTAAVFAGSVLSVRTLWPRRSA